MAKNECFFCGEDIDGRISREHIFGNSFLKYLDLKQETITSSLPNSTEYSRIKVSSHEHCNNESGSWFEDYVLKIIKSMDSNPEHLARLHLVTDEPINQAIRQILTQWLAKLYYGLIYWESKLKNHSSPDYQRQLIEMLQVSEFRHLRKCFVDGIAFQAPSSICHFQIPESPETAFRFDFGNGFPHGLFYIRFNNHLLVTAIGDGNLVVQWFGQDIIDSVQTTIAEQSSTEPIAYLHAVAHFWAVREWLPVLPRLDYSKNSILDRSRETIKNAPPIDSKAVNARAAELFAELAQKWGVAVT